MIHELVRILNECHQDVLVEKDDVSDNNSLAGGSSKVDNALSEVYDNFRCLCQTAKQSDF